MPQYRLTPKALKQMRKLDMDVRKKIFEKLDYFMGLSDPLEFAEPVTDPALGQYRFRVGDYRVIFDVKDELFKILKVGHRKDIYK